MRHIDPILYEIDDKVLRLSTINTEEALITKLDYSKPLVIKDTEMITTTDITYQILQFEDSKSWHVAINFRPLDFSRADFDDIRNKYDISNTTNKKVKLTFKPNVKIKLV
jgi:hypothetical protein